jgi:hypothetical protein
MMSKDNPKAPEASQTLDDAFTKGRVVILLEKLVEQNERIIRLLQEENCGD